MDGCVVAVQVEDFGLPKSAEGTVGRTSKIFRILTHYFQAVQVEDLGRGDGKTLSEGVKACVEILNVG